MKKYIWTIYLLNLKSKKYIPYWQIFSESSLKRAVKHLKRSGYRFRIRKKKVSLERYRERKQELKQLFIPKKRI